METVIIGNQEWCTENLNIEKFNNGDSIAEIQSFEEWIEAAKQKIPAWCYHNNDPENAHIYGKLYNWYTVIDSRGISPDGFRVPTKKDIEDLIINLTGGVRRSSEMIREKRVAGKDLKKNISDWSTPGLSKARLRDVLKNEKLELEQLEIDNPPFIADLKIGLGFNAVPGGYRMALGYRDFQPIGSAASFWTSTLDDYVYSEDQIAFGIELEAYHFGLDYFSGIATGKKAAQGGYSIRLVRNI